MLIQSDCRVRQFPMRSHVCNSKISSVQDGISYKSSMDSLAVALQIIFCKITNALLHT